jgi:Na+-driven multidrug efflux pump
MVETITPAVHGGRKSRYLASMALHLIGAALTAAALGALLGAAGALMGAPWGRLGTAAVAAIALVYAAREIFALPIPLFDGRRQVPEWWRTFYSPPVAAFLYGAGLGPGFFTFLSYGTFVAVSVTALCTGNPLLGALLSTPFGVARAATVVVGYKSSSEAVDRLTDVASTGAVRKINTAALIALALAALLALV